MDVGWTHAIEGVNHRAHPPNESFQWLATWQLKFFSRMKRQRAPYHGPLGAAARSTIHANAALLVVYLWTGTPWLLPTYGVNWPCRSFVLGSLSKRLGPDLSLAPILWQGTNCGTAIPLLPICLGPAPFLTTFPFPWILSIVQTRLKNVFPWR